MNPVITPSSKAPGFFNPCTYKVIYPGFSNFAFSNGSTCGRYVEEKIKWAKEAQEDNKRHKVGNVQVECS